MAYRNKRILLVDDNSSDVELAIHALKQNQFTKSIVVVQDGAEALDYLFCRGTYVGREPEDRPTLILLDLNLPKVDGLEVLKNLRSDYRTRAIPVVILTSSKESKDVVDGYRLGTNAYIQKPVDFERFRNTIRDIGAFWLLANEPPPAEAFVV